MSALTAPFDPSPVALGDLGDRLVELRRAVRDADWSAVLAQGTASLGAGHAWSPQLVAAATAYDEVRRDAAARTAVLGEAFARLAARPDHAAVAAAARAQLAAADPALAQRMEPALSRIEAGQPPAPGQIAGTSAPAGRAHDLAVAAMSRGLRALAHQTWAALAPDPAGVDLAVADSTLTTLRARVEHDADALARRERALHDAVDAQNGVAQAARDLADHVEATVLGGVAAQSRAFAVAVALREAGRGGDAERLGAALLLAARTTREAFAAHAAARAVAAEAGSSTPSALVASVLEVGVAHDRSLPRGLATDVAHLPGVADGTLVRVRGFATAVTHRREADGKLVGEVTLLDPSSGAEVRVVVVFVHLANAGLTLGSYVEAHGVLQHTAALLGGTRGVVVDVLPLVELARTSWRLRLQALGARWTPVWRNGHHLAWSWGAHVAAPDDAATADRGAAELVFTPFVREV